MEFDPRLLVEGAQRLHAQAVAMMVKAAVFGGLLGAGGGLLVAGAHVKALAQVQDNLLIGAAAAIGGVIGFSIGKERAFWIRLQVQQLLALAKVEERTRTLSDPGVK